jgi:hypothetical protein
MDLLQMEQKHGFVCICKKDNGRLDWTKKEEQR